MNDQRYKSYLFISRVLRSDLFTALERDVLTDAAEGLLLTREADWAQIEDLELNARAALDGMAAARRIHGTTAAEILERIRDCGPACSPFRPGRQRVRNKDAEQAYELGQSTQSRAQQSYRG